MKIVRISTIASEVEVPQDCEVCSYCEGKGMISKYDEGWRTPVHSEEHAALKICFDCQGAGYIQLHEKEKETNS